MSARRRGEFAAMVPLAAIEGATSFNTFAYERYHENSPAAFGIAVHLLVAADPEARSSLPNRE